MKEKTEIAAPVEGYHDALDDLVPRLHGASKYRHELAERILVELSKGLSLRSACRVVHGAPDESTVRMWAKDNVADFAPQYARARDVGMDSIVDGLIELSDSANGQNANAIRLMVDTRKWVASKIAPKRYGDQLTLTGADGGPIQVAAVDDRELARRVALLLSQVSELPVIEGKAETDEGS